LVNIASNFAEFHSTFGGKTIMLKVLLLTNDRQLSFELKEEVSNCFPNSQFLEEPLSSYGTHKKEFCVNLVFVDLECVPIDCAIRMHNEFKQVAKFIFIGMNSDHKCQFIHLGAIDYFLKPMLMDDLKHFIYKYKCTFGRKFPIYKKEEKPKKKCKAIDKLLVWDIDKMKTIDLSRIIKIKSDGAYSNIHLNNNEKMVSSKNLGIYENILKASNFIRIHNSCLVNAEHIKFYKPGAKAYITMSDSKIEFISKNRKGTFLKHFNLK
jgi:two-component system, LytTR family, response regulator